MSEIGWKFVAFDALTLSELYALLQLRSEVFVVEQACVFQDEHGIALGSRVQITSESFGPEPTEGELIAATRMHYTLRREDERAGTVHVHLPRIGYVLKEVKAA